MGISTLKGKEMEDYPIKMNEKACPERWEENGCVCVGGVR